jgi:hypothetical protein
LKDDEYRNHQLDSLAGSREVLAERTGGKFFNDAARINSRTSQQESGLRQSASFRAKLSVGVQAAL